jgi:hypothetical protein
MIRWNLVAIQGHVGGARLPVLAEVAERDYWYMVATLLVMTGLMTFSSLLLLKNS